MDVMNPHQYNPAHVPVIPPKPSQIAGGTAKYPSPHYPPNPLNEPSTNSVAHLNLPLLPTPPLVQPPPLVENTQRQNTLPQTPSVNTLRQGYNPVLDNPVVGGDSFDDEPVVPSYPHYFKGAKHNETVIQSKPYEHTTPQCKYDTALVFGLNCHQVLKIVPLFK